MSQAYAQREDTQVLWEIAEDYTKRKDSKKASTVTKSLVHYLLEDTVGTKFEHYLDKCLLWEHFALDAKRLERARHIYFTLLKDYYSTEHHKWLFDEFASFVDILPVEKEKNWRSCLKEISKYLNEEISEELLSTSEVAEKFHVSPQAVIKWCEKEKIECIKTPGGTWKIPAYQFTTTKEQDKAIDKFFSKMWAKHADKPPVSDEDIIKELKKGRK
ncbi:MAG: hypothetical protein IBX64_08265 [Actinobacteria bacterium]|nr:hypothetical protein [Actinomycetota bacterium]